LPFPSGIRWLAVDGSRLSPQTSVNDPKDDAHCFSYFAGLRRFPFGQRLCGLFIGFRVRRNRAALAEGVAQMILGDSQKALLVTSAIACYIGVLFLLFRLVGFN
jgi:hypothetical protein